MQWFRLYNRMVDDDSIRLLAFEDRWHFVALCCLKSEGLLDKFDGDMRLRRVALRLGVQVRELEEIARRLREVDLIDESLQPVKWDNLQFKHETSTKRVQAFRARQKATQKTAKKQGGNATKQHETVSETPPETDTDTETEVLEPKGSCPSGDGLKPAHVFEKWNEVALRIGKSTVRDLTPARMQLLKSRIAQYPIEDFVAVFAAVENSQFLRDGRFCTFDWCMKRGNFQKIIEGNYSD